MRWFERKFNFDNLAGTFPGILERLIGTPLKLEEKLSLIPLDYHTVQLEGSWSIQENVGHLLDSESLWMGRFEDFVSGVEILREADLTNTKTNQAHHNQASLVVLLKDFRKQREAMIEFIRPLAKDADVLTSLHPRLMQPMRLIDLAYFVAEHDDHHLARISTIWNTLDNK